jgi:hypothetical protein
VKWAVELLGEDFDLHDARELFASGAVRVETLASSKTVLIADDFESLTEVLQVREAAKRLIDLINGALFLHDAARNPVRIGSLHENRDGKWHQHAIITPEPAVFRTKFYSATVTVNGVPDQPQPPPERKWVHDALSDDVVADVLNYLRGKPDWFELYKAFERMRDDINQRLGGQHRQEKMGWPAKGDLDSFSESANVHRHSPAKWGRLNPTTAMKLDDARSYVNRLAQTWLKWRT